MRYAPHILEEIRARLPASDVVGRRVRLKKAGREWRGLSPFNAEKTPSFYVNDQKQFYHCFSSGKHGDIFTFLMETEGLSFPEAVERLAAEAGVTLPKPTPEGEARERQQRSLHDVTEMACAFFEEQLRGSGGAVARRYLEGRAIAPPAQAEFRLGYAPDQRDALLRHLRGRGVEDAMIVAAGLAIRPDDGRPLYDRFRDRVIFPIEDRRGRVIAFGGRALSDGKGPKYLNSPETELFTKGRHVFNGHRARAPAHRNGCVVVVEGYVDAIAVYQAGIKSVVATLGTAFTEEQIATLWSYADEPVICFDGDKAGRAAAYRSVDRILPQLKTGKSFRFAFLADAKDPDELIRAKGREAFSAAVDHAFTLWDMLWSREVEAADVSTPDRQAVVEKRLTDLIHQIPDERLRRLYSLRAKVYLSDLFWRLTRGRDQKPGAPSPDRRRVRPTVVPRVASDAEPTFLGLCVERPDKALDEAERTSLVHFQGRVETESGGIAYQVFFDALMLLLQSEHIAGAHDIYRRIDARFYEALDHLHGRETPALASGHRLRERLKVLNYNPTEDFVDSCFDHLLDILVLREQEGAIARLAQEAAASAQQAEGTFDEIVANRAAANRLMEKVNHDGLALAEEAEQFRSASGSALGHFSIAA